MLIMKISFVRSINQFAVSNLGVIQDSDDDLTALMMRNGFLSSDIDKDTDEDEDIDTDEDTDEDQVEITK
jgi:hypothetical protein